MARRKKLTWIEKFMWTKLIVGLFVAIFALAMAGYNLLALGATEAGIREFVKWGIVSGVWVSIAIAGTIGGCLG